MTGRFATMTACVLALGAAPYDFARPPLIAEADRLHKAAVRAYQAGDVNGSLKLFDGSLKARLKAAPPRGADPVQHGDLADTLNAVGAIMMRANRPASAETYAHNATEVNRLLWTKFRIPFRAEALAACLVNRGVIRNALGKYEAAEADVREALALRAKMFDARVAPNGHQLIAATHMALGKLYRDRDDPARALGPLREAEAMLRRLAEANPSTANDERLAAATANVGQCLIELGDLTPGGKMTEEALRLFRRTFARTAPDGHPNLVIALLNASAVRRRADDFDGAEKLLRESVAMCERLYPADGNPTGHAETFGGMEKLGLLLRERGKFAEAEKLLRASHAMSRTLHPESVFPAGLAERARATRALCLVLEDANKHDEAGKLLRGMLAQMEKHHPPEAFPDGTPEFARLLCHLACHHHLRGDHEAGLPHARRALRMGQRQLDRRILHVSEAQALNASAVMPVYRDAYLSLSDAAPSSADYPLIWQSKAAVSRIQERRHVALRTSASDDVRQTWMALNDARRRQEALLFAPATADESPARQKALDAVSAEAARLETKLAGLFPESRLSERYFASTPGDLQKALPAKAVFVDFLAYTHYDWVRTDKSYREVRTRKFVAFLTAPDRIGRFEIGEVSKVRAAVGRWRKAIRDDADDEPKAAAAVRKLIWEPMAKLVPAGSTVYISPDLDLTFLPFAALPGTAAGTRLVEEVTPVMVPHGPMLLERLTAAKRKVPDRPVLLTVGGVAYDGKPSFVAGRAGGTTRGPAVAEKVVWPELPATAGEADLVAKVMADHRRVSRTGTAADAKTILADLPTATVAHLATHGFFADRAFRGALQLDETLFAGRAHVTGLSERIGAGARSPLVLSGLVCAGANDPAAPGRGILTADAVVGLDLRKMSLAVLSACETGLGDAAGGEGVYGLVRAFHVAGAGDVVAGLWKVEDKAAAALMALFYRGLRDPKEPLPPREALRRAQLALMRRPEHVAEWSAGRGPNLKAVVDAPAVPVKPGAKRTPVRAWAAFVLSGAG